MTGSDALIDEHFDVKQRRDLTSCVDGFWYARRRDGGVGFLRADGVVRVGVSPETSHEPTGWFEDYADVVAAYEIWLKQEGKR